MCKLKERKNAKNPLSMVKIGKMQGHGSLAGEKNESPNFREPRALECVSGYGKLEYALFSVFDFGPASVRWPTGQGPIRPFWEKF
jgi:hypothetical protein